MTPNNRLFSDKSSSRYSRLCIASSIIRETLTLKSKFEIYRLYDDELPFDNVKNVKDKKIDKIRWILKNPPVLKTFSLHFLNDFLFIFFSFCSHGWICKFVLCFTIKITKLKSKNILNYTTSVCLSK